MKFATPSHQPKLNNYSTNEYYGTLAKEVYSAAKKERWTPDRVKQMLTNPRDFEKYLNRVS